MNNSLLSLWASNIYPQRFPAISALGEGPAPAPPFLSPHPLRVWGLFFFSFWALSRPVWRLLSQRTPRAPMSLWCVRGAAHTGQELPTPAARATCLPETVVPHPSSRVLPAGVTQTSVTSGATRPCTWQPPMATCTVCPSWCPSGPTSGAWTTTTTRRWTWPP